MNAQSTDRQEVKTSNFPVLQCCVWVPVMFVSFPSESEAQWRSVQVARLSTPAGVFCFLLLLLHRCLLAHMSCHMFPAWSSPEGAESVFTHNLHSLTRPSLSLTGAHGVVFMKRSRSITLPFFSFSFPPPFMNSWITFVSISLVYFHIPSWRSGWKAILIDKDN